MRENLRIYTYSYVKIQNVHKVCCKFKFYWNDSQRKWFKPEGQNTWNREKMSDFPGANSKDETHLKYHTKYFPSRPWVSGWLVGWFYAFYVGCFAIFLDCISFQKASGSCCANAKPQVERALWDTCARNQWLLPQRAPGGEGRYVAAGRVAVCSILWCGGGKVEMVIKLRMLSRIRAFQCFYA